MPVATAKDENKYGAKANTKADAKDEAVAVVEAPVEAPPLVPASDPGKVYWVWRDGPGGWRVFDSFYPHFNGADPISTFGQPDMVGGRDDIMTFIRKDTPPA